MSRYTLPSEMADDEAMDYAAEHTAMTALELLAITNLIDAFEGRDIVELRRQIEIAVRIKVREALAAKRTDALLTG